MEGRQEQGHAITFLIPSGIQRASCSPVCIGFGGFPSRLGGCAVLDTRMHHAAHLHMFAWFAAAKSASCGGDVEDAQAWLSAKMTILSLAKLMARQEIAVLVL